MNLYFLVEGRTELNVYPAWLSYLIPELTKVEYFDKVIENNYYLFSSYGIPYIETDIINAIKDINSIGKYKHFRDHCKWQAMLRNKTLLSEKNKRKML